MLPFVPELLRAKSVITVRACYCGRLDEAEAHFQTWQEAPEPLASFLEGAEAQGRLVQAFALETLLRLKVLKAQYDSEDRFRFGLCF